MKKHPSREPRKGILLESGTNEVEFFEFSVADECYGVNVSKVTQILVWNSLRLTELPSCNRRFLGTVPFRGRCIPAFDLRACLDLPPAEVNTQQLLLVMEFNQKTNGFVIDKVHNIQRVSWSDFTPVAANDAIQTESSVIGTVTIDGRIIMILDIEAMMSEIDPSHSVSYYADQIKMGSPRDRSSLHLMYCEDSGLIRKITLEALAKAGYANISSFGTGAEALTFLMDEDSPAVDIILSDIEMPELDGLALCKAVRASQSHAKIPFIFFSSLINEQMKAKCAEMKGDAAFSKPELHLVADAIDELYTKSR